VFFFFFFMSPQTASVANLKFLQDENNQKKKTF